MMDVAARAMLKPWRCGGIKGDGALCTRILIEVDWTKPMVLRKRCDRCNTINMIDWPGSTDTTIIEP